MTMRSRLIRVGLCFGVLVVFLINHTQAQRAAAQLPTGQESLAQPAVATAGARHLSIPAAAFVPAAAYNSYENHGRYLKHFAQPPELEAGYYVAPIQLPQGAILSKLTFYYRDTTVGQAIADLVRHKHDTQGTLLMAEVVSSDTWTPGFGSASTTNFNPTAVIDNSLYSYYVHLSLPPDGQVWGCGVEIEYFPPAPTSTSSIMSVPPAAFAPYEDGYAYFNAGWNLVHNNGATVPGNRGWYLAPLHLPDGAIMTRMVFHWLREDTLQTGTARLQRTLLGADTFQDMAVASSATGTGVFMSSTGDSTINGALIDNMTYAYWLILDLPATNVPGARVEAREVDIEFQLPPASAGRVSVPAAGFRPYEDGYDYEDHGRHLLHMHGPAGSLNNGWYLAPLSLPDGATVRKMTFYWYRNGTFTGVARLQRTKLGNGNYEDLATASVPTGSAMNGSNSDSTIGGGPIDNSQYAYWLTWDLPANATATLGVHGQAVVIEYGFRVFLPTIQRR